MMRYLLAAAVALLAAAPASGQAACDLPANSKVATSTDKAALQKGLDCLKARIKGREDSIVGLTAANKIDATQRDARAARIAKLNAQPATPAPSPTPTPTPKPPAPVTPPLGQGKAAIASNFDTSAFISTGLAIPGTAAPDVVGAFRLICQPLPGSNRLGFVDPMVWPGVVGKSELHEFAGNTAVDENSTYETLRVKGDSSCMNLLNRSSYWHQALLTGDDKYVISFDYISLYYKRFPVWSPLCARAIYGCVNLPNGLQAKADVTSFRCFTNQIHRDTIDEAIKDCGGEGQVLASITFGDCWNGQLDSPDHYSHLIPFSGKKEAPWELECKAGYNWIIPQLTQTIAWTIKKSDGAVHFSTGPGHKLHGNYQLAWDQPTLDTAMDNCINKLLNCSDGDLGNGSILKRWAGFGYLTEPRLVLAPLR